MTLPLHNQAPHSSSSDLALALSGLLEAQHILTDHADLTLYGNDVFFWDDVRLPDAVVRPSSAKEIASIIAFAKQHHYCVIARGGGMSYTKGYLQNSGPSILIDTSRFNQIIEINPADRFMVVGAGCTWLNVIKAASEHGLVPSLISTPLSGSHSTVGGAASQNLPGTMAGFLGLEVVLPTGEVVRTGSWGRKNNASGFYRNFGPDLTGLFLGDCGAFGIKTAVVLHLKRKPKALGYGSFAFETYEDLAATMIELAGMDQLITRLGLDPHESRAAPQVAWKQGIKTLTEVARTGNSLLGGITESMKMALAGRDFMADAGWTLHIKSEGINQAAADAAIDEARTAIMNRAKNELPPILLRAAEATGPSVRKFLGKNGERWVATNAMFPIGRAVEVATKVQAFFADRETEIQRHGVKVSYVTSCSPFHFMCEPCFTWEDEMSELHLNAVLPEEAEAFRSNPAKPEARAYVQRLRAELRDFVFQLGAVHVQLAKFYPYQDALSPETAALTNRIKHMLDPDLLMNPGNLGFTAKPPP